MKKILQPEEINLEQFEKNTQDPKAKKAVSLAWDEIIAVGEGRKSVTDKTKLMAVALGVYAKMMGAEAHRMAMEIMVRQKLIKMNDLPALPEPK